MSAKDHKGFVRFRAQTPNQKRAVIESLLESWERCPEQRLGQLIENACETHAVMLFQVEDEGLIDCVDSFAKMIAAKKT